MKALIVDDEASNRENLQMLLKTYADDVQVCAEAESVAEAIGAIKQHQPQLVFLDIQLHAQTGFDLLQQLGDYVTVKCKGDRTMILSSGFDATSEDNSNKLPPSVEMLEVELGQSGEATTRVKNVTGVKAYVHQYTTEQPTETTVWTSETTAHRTHTFKGLKPLVIHWFRVIAVGLNGQSVISDPVARAVL